MKMESLSVSVYEFGPGVCVCARDMVGFFFLSLSLALKRRNFLMSQLLLGEEGCYVWYRNW